MNKFPTINEQMDIIKRGVQEIIPEKELEEKIVRSIKSNKPLQVKLGCDPSRPDLHLGHSVVLKKLRHFQDLGHQAILIIGDFTGIIGDPTGKNKTRPSLTLEETKINGKTYFDQASKILSSKNVTIKYNSEWLANKTFADIIHISSKYTIARMLERDDFTQRYKSGEPIAMHEFLYPLAQAYDSVAIKADVELGGTDQKFNLLVGRDLQKEFGQMPQVIITLPLLVGTDGIDKMSKSLNNYIGISESPKDIYGKTLSIPDNLIIDYFTLATDVSTKSISNSKKLLDSGEINPRDVKRELARELVALYYSKEIAENAEKEFDEIFVKKNNPTNIEEFILNSKSISLLQLLVDTKLCESKSQARRVIEQGGVSIENKKITDPMSNVTISESAVLKVGKRNFLKLIPFHK
ncbi:MAG: tyrosine--tRNA ligase [Ignavibacteria bacterium]|nr:tyrosine--tRNA ligase [Bacteroidota bacterium]MSQ45910.1 tyrosine--tRNA ligase [Ignavibacteria bacterium]